MEKSSDAKNNSSTRASRISRLRSDNSPSTPDRGIDKEQESNTPPKVSKYKKILLAAAISGALAVAAGVGDVIGDEAIQCAGFVELQLDRAGDAGRSPGDHLRAAGGPLFAAVGSDNGEGGRRGAAGADGVEIFIF